MVALDVSLKTRTSKSRDWWSTPEDGRPMAAPRVGQTGTSIGPRSTASRSSHMHARVAGTWGFGELFSPAAPAFYKSWHHSEARRRICIANQPSALLSVDPNSNVSFAFGFTAAA
ncbi:hypothetical protein J3459_017143 [Metarhizium acridum]|nr:hypothetical protein J3459_017143 [Metarhizium acridum]